uniref:AlNc14C245G9534 protein n=1 Tax=Albugo laibachii Nc14 TaxID=890382 RepID=F0WT50_9STRA|nr:AlNc14C245G9534 [Albugo laibachii Nc14]CCA25974.1 AlNc14C337G10750 [Albugo laibachii Nc14]|eukprot:CCA25974.1 AlNc14C337G10750 [Albugo laibachii Nc14]
MNDDRTQSLATSSMSSHSSPSKIPCFLFADLALEVATLFDDKQLIFWNLERRPEETFIRLRPSATDGEALSSSLSRILRPFAQFIRRIVYERHLQTLALSDSAD